MHYLYVHAAHTQTTPPKPKHGHTIHLILCVHSLISARCAQKHTLMTSLLPHRLHTHTPEFALASVDKTPCVDVFTSRSSSQRSSHTRSATYDHTTHINLCNVVTSLFALRTSIGHVYVPLRTAAHTHTHTQEARTFYRGRRARATS